MKQEQRDKVISALLTIAEHISQNGLNELEVALHYRRQVNKAKPAKKNL